MDKKENVLKEKSYSFALRIIKAYKHLAYESKNMFCLNSFCVPARRLVQNVAEANQAQSRPDFVSKLGIALKETVETEYWLNLLRDSHFLTESQADSLLKDCLELKAILIASIKTTKSATAR